MEQPRDIGRTLGVALCVIALGAGLLWKLTSGLQIFTSETWRRAEIASAPRALPDTWLEDERGQTFNLRSLCGQVMVLDFIYTRCPTVCKSLGVSSSQLAKHFTQTGQTVTVMSVSFDPLYDNPARLHTFKQQTEPQPSAWRLARPVHNTERDHLLTTAGVMVIPDGMQGYEHNAALHIIDKNCRITQLLDMEDVEHAQRTVQTLL
ncbi:SCO family protein [Limnohabitans sp.]|uniref:SCO family protein n=1 Tax=Limnohabitans sp. TaxID=1907725 RepID=UPI00286F23DA|nr:SCO family protein [Limnohabitans sp.]